MLFVNANCKLSIWHILIFVEWVVDWPNIEPIPIDGGDAICSNEIYKFENHRCAFPLISSCFKSVLWNANRSVVSMLTQSIDYRSWNDVLYGYTTYRNFVITGEDKLLFPQNIPSNFLIEFLKTSIGFHHHNKSFL
jgi:hypothetical protein